jgi:hypothetical protein
LCYKDSEKHWFFVVCEVILIENVRSAKSGPQNPQFSPCWREAALWMGMAARDTRWIVSDFVRALNEAKPKWKWPECQVDGPQRPSPCHVQDRRVTRRQQYTTVTHALSMSCHALMHVRHVHFMCMFYVCTASVHVVYALRTCRPMYISYSH